MGKKIKLYRVIMLVLFVALCASTTTVSAEAKKSSKKTKVASYGYDSSGKWAYKIISKKKKTVSIRPATMDKKLDIVNSGNVTVPSKIKINKNKYTVVKIPDGAFTTCMGDECFISNESLKKRWAECSKHGYDNMFSSSYSYTSIKSITIPASVTEIGKYAFAGQSNLATLTILNNSKLTTIGEYAFAMTKIGAFTAQSKLANIGKNSFWKCTSLQNLSLEKCGIKTVEEKAFSETAIKSVKLPASCKAVSDYAFAGCQKLKTLTIGANEIEDVAETAFDGDEISSVFVKNHKIYLMLKNKYMLDDVMKNATVKSDQTMCHFIVDGVDNKVYINKGYREDYIRYGKYDVGMTGDVARVVSVTKLDGTKSDEISLKANDYIATGFPEEYIYIETKDIQYKLMPENDYNYFESTDRHFSCDIAEQPENQYCYFDNMTLSEIADTEAYEKPGYYINGYKIDGKVYGEHETVGQLADKDGAELKIGFNYVPNTYTVEYDENGGTDDVKGDRYCTYDEMFNITDEVPTYNLKFVGWNTQADGLGVMYSRGQSVKNLAETADEEVVLYAIWSEQEVNVKLNCDGGKCDKSVVAIKPGRTYSSLPTPTKEGYNFYGWMLENGSFAEDTVTVLNYDHTLTAMWREKCENVSLTVKPDNASKAKGYQIECYKAGKRIYKRTVAKSGVKEVSYKFEHVEYNTEVILKVRTYTITKKNGKKFKVWGKWKTVKKTVK